MIGEEKSRGRTGRVSVLSSILVCMVLSGCETATPRDPTVIRLDAEVRLLKAAGRPVARQCLDALAELTQTVKTMQKEHLSEDKKDPVAEDVLQSDQRAAERLCRPDAATLCQAPTGDDAVAACKTLQRVPEPASVY
jgi:hypothetical protein